MNVGHGSVGSAPGFHRGYGSGRNALLTQQWHT